LISRTCQPSGKKNSCNSSICSTNKPDKITLPLLAIIFSIGFFIGSSLGMINGVLALMDPVGALITLIFLELLIKARFMFLKSKKPIILIRVFDMFRIGLAYGLISEGLKLL